MIIFGAYKVKEIAFICNVAIRTVQHWLQTGKLQGYRSDFEGMNPRQWLVTEEAFTTFLNKYPKYKGE